MSFAQIDQQGQFVDPQDFDRWSQKVVQLQQRKHVWNEEEWAALNLLGRCLSSELAAADRPALAQFR